MTTLRISLLLSLSLFCCVSVLYVPNPSSSLELVTLNSYHNYSLTFSEVQNQTTYVSLRIWGYFLQEPNENSKSLTIFLVSSANESRIQRRVFGLAESSGNESLASSLLPQSNSGNNYVSFVTSFSLSNLTLLFTTNSLSSVPLYMSVSTSKLFYGTDVLISSFLLCLLYVLIAAEIGNKSVIAMLLATLTIGTLTLISNEKPSLEEIITWLDIETLLLLFSMMMIVSLLSETGVFAYIGCKAFQASHHQLWPFISILCITTMIISAFLDNVTTILLLSPIVIKFCEAYKADVSSILSMIVILSNIGGAATVIGDPPNVIIASNSRIASELNFFNFFSHMCPITLLVGLTIYFYLKHFVFFSSSFLESEKIRSIQKEIIIWKNTYEKLEVFSFQDKAIKDNVERKIKELKESLKSLNAEEKHPSVFNIQELESASKITNKVLLIQSLIVLFLMYTLFFLSNLSFIYNSLGWISLLASLILLVLSNKRSIESLLIEIEWSTLLFIASLFVVMRGLNKLGLHQALGLLFHNVIVSLPRENQLLASILSIVWISGLASAFMDNIPLTTMMVPLMISLSDSCDLPLVPLVLSLSCGTCFGGNGTLIGASANLVCAGLAEKHGYKMSFLDFFKIGFPVTIISLFLSSLYLLFCHVVIKWN